MPGRRFLAVFGLILFVAQPARAQEPDSTALDSADVAVTVYAPPRFAHDQFFLGYAASFSAASTVVDGDLPGRIGLEGYALADRLPGVAFRRNGTPYQAAEYAWSGGDGQALSVWGDRTNWNAEPLGYPPYGANDPLLLPGPSDTVFLQPAPLTGYAPVGLNYWRDPTLPDSANAAARYINGPFGYSSAGGRFRADVGRGWEFDGQFYNVLADGAIDSTSYAGHNLDIELRRSFGTNPLRVRFRQNRGRRAQSFRWQAGTPKGYRASYDYLLSHLDVEFAVPGSTGEWLVGWQMRQEDQKKWADSLLGAEQRWFARNYELKVSRLWQGRVSGWVSARGRWWEKALGDSPGTRRDLEIEGGVVVPYRNAQITVTAAGRTINLLSAEERAAAAFAWQVSRSHRLLAHIGVAKQQPSHMRFWLPAQGAGGNYTESGNASLPVTRHQTASLSWRHSSSPLQFTLLASAGTSRDLAVWQPVGDTATEQSAYAPVPFDREFALAGLTFRWQPLRFLILRASYDHLFRNVWNGEGSPVFAPDDQWSAALLVPVRFSTRRMRLIPQVHTRGAAGGSLPDEYATLSAGFEFHLKQFVFYWLRENILDLEYRTGGAEFAYPTHSRYGFRWEFWN
jgi:hypothetical protein